MEFILLKQPRVLPRRALYQIAKRTLDISLCLLALPVTLPLMLLVAVAIYLNSPGPVIFSQERIGKGGRIFRIYKFRTMHINPDVSHCRTYMRAYVRGEITENKDGTKVFKPHTEQDILRIGRILRKTSLDELPQIYNILRGDMSIVGPRPNVLYEVDAYRPWHHERLEVLPGITGLAQVRGRSCLDFATIARYDIEYIEKRCLSLDIKILWWTFLVALKGKGAQ